MRIGQLVELAAAGLRNQVVGGNLASLTMAARPRRMANYVAECLFLYKSITGSRGLPQKNVFEILPPGDTAPVVFGSLDGGTWFFESPSYVTDLVSLCLLCRALRPKTIFEIGTLTGYTAYHMALNAPEAAVFTLDLPRGGAEAPKLGTTAVDGQHIGRSLAAERLAFDGTPEAGRVTRLFGDSATFDYGPYERKVDLFFIDGAHSYEYVRSDTLHAVRCVRPGGVIAWHDFGRAGVNGVSRWLIEFAGQGHDVYSVPGGSLAFAVMR